MSFSASAVRPGTNPFLLFVLLCLVWGSTWLSLKVGVAIVPPVTFAAARFLLAGIALLMLGALRGRVGVPLATIAPGAVLMIAINYGLMAWGIARVPSGIASVINLSTVPSATLLLSVAHGQARWSAISIGAVAAGCAGLLLLFGPNFGAAGVVGMAAIAAGASAYAWGGVLTKQRPAADPIALAGWQSLTGGVLLALAALASEPIDETTLTVLAAPPALANLTFLVVGAVIGGSVYLMLLARWSASRVATYAFICPLIALTEGAVFNGERPGPSELAAAGVLLLATVLSLAAQTKEAA